MGLFSGPPEKRGLELGPARNQNQNSSSLPRGGDQSPILSSGWRPFDQIPASRTGGLEKQGRIGRVKERRQRGKGREINKVSCSLPVGALWPVVRVRRRPGTKGSQLGHWVWSIGRQAGPWVPRVLRMSVSSKKSRHLLKEEGPLPGPKTGLLSNTRKWIVRGDTCADKGNLVRVSDPWSEDDISDLVYSSQVKGAFWGPAYMEGRPFCAAKSD